MDYVKLWRPDSGGWRAVVIFKVGHTLAHALEPTTGTLYSFPKRELRACKPIDKPRWRKLAKQVKTVRGYARDYNWRIADKALAELQKKLREEARIA